MTTIEQVPAGEIRTIDFGKFILVSILFFALIGLLFGVFGLVGSITGGTIFIRFGGLYLEGIRAGLLGLPLLLLLFGLAGGVVGLVSFFPINWVYRHI